MNNFVIVLSAPSGTGKTTVVQGVLKKNKSLERVVTHTTREKRKGEKNKKDYHFVTQEDFKKSLKEKKFVEWASHYGHFYGTSKKEIARIQKKGKTPILVIENVGAKQVKKLYPSCVFILLLPPTYQELKRRMKKRKSESKASMELRLKLAKKEVRSMLWYDYLVLNKNVSSAVQDIGNILNSCERKISLNKGVIEKFLSGK